MKTVYAFLLLSSVSALASAGYIENPTYVADSGRAGEIGFVVQLLQLIGTQFGLNNASGTRSNHLSNDEAAVIIASLHGQNRLSNANTAAIVDSLYANGHGHQSRSSGLSHDVIPAVVTGLYASGYGHKTNQVSSHIADSVKVATSSSLYANGHGHQSLYASGYGYKTNQVSSHTADSVKAATFSSHATSTGHYTRGGYKYRGHKK